MAKEASPEAHQKELGSSSEDLYFTKDGRTLLGPAPTAFAFSYPFPPLPTDLNKNRVFRPKEEENEKVLKEEIEKESKPLDTLEIDGKSLDRMLVPDIELALYWDRHPYEFRPSSLDKRAKSAMNLSSLGELLQTDSSRCDQHSAEDDRRNGSSRRSSVNSKTSKTIKNSRGSSANTVIRNNESSRRNSSSSAIVNNNNNFMQNNEKSERANVGDNKCSYKSKSPSPEDIQRPQSESLTQRKMNQPNNNNKIPQILQVLKTNEKSKFKDLPSKNQSTTSIRNNNKDNKNNNCEPNSSPVYLVRDEKFARSGCTPIKSIGTQASFDDVMTAALKSTYLCPLHGQFNKGVERRDKSGFRTDMSQTQVKPHSTCSRSKPKTKLIKSAEIQTDPSSEYYELQKNFDLINDGGSKRVRSKTAVANNPSSKRNTVHSEYHGNFRHPGHIAESENRRLRNKILSHCFTKHSIF